MEKGKPMAPGIGRIEHPLEVELGAGVSLGSLGEGDAETLGDCFAAMEPWVRYGTTREVLTGFFAREEAQASRLVLRFGGQPAGLAVVRRDWLRGPYVQFLGLVPDFQGQGLGKRFLDWLEAEATALGDRHVWIMVSDFNARGRTFYKRQGYEEIAAVPDVIKDGFIEILLRKRL